MEAAEVALRRGGPRRSPGLAIGKDIGQWTFATFIGLRSEHWTVIPCQSGYVLQTILKFSQDLSKLLHGLGKY